MKVCNLNLKAIVRFKQSKELMQFDSVFHIKFKDGSKTSTKANASNGKSDMDATEKAGINY